MVKQHFKRKITIILLSISLNMCLDSFFEYPQHMFWSKKIRKTHSYLEGWLFMI